MGKLRRSEAKGEDLWLWRRFKFFHLIFHSVMTNKGIEKLFHLKKKWKKCSLYLFSWNVLPNIFSSTKHRRRKVFWFCFDFLHIHCHCHCYCYCYCQCHCHSIIAECRMWNVESIARALQWNYRMADVKRKEKKRKKKNNFSFKKKLSDLLI